MEKKKNNPSDLSQQLGQILDPKKHCPHGGAFCSSPAVFPSAFGDFLGTVYSFIATGEMKKPSGLPRVILEPWLVH